MYNVYVKRIFVITEIVHMNAGVSYEKEKVKESQLQSRRVAPPLDIHFGCRVGGVTNINKNCICILLNIVYSFYLIIKYSKVKNIKYKNQTSLVLPIIINISKTK